MTFIDITDPNYNHLGTLESKIPAIKTFLGQGFLINGGFPRDMYDKKENQNAPDPRDIDIFIKRPSGPFNLLNFLQFQTNIQTAIDSKIQISPRYDNPLDVIRATYLLHNMFFIPFLDQEILDANGLIEGHLYTVSNNCIEAMQNRQIVLSQEFKDDFDAELSAEEINPKFGFYFSNLNKYLLKYVRMNYKLSADTKLYFKSIADRLEQKTPSSEEQLHFLQKMFVILFTVMGVDYRPYANSSIQRIREAAIKFQTDLPAIRNAGLIAYDS